MYRKIRIMLAAIVYLLVTMLFLDVSGILQESLHVFADIQFMPALLALNLGCVAVLLLFTLLFGRVYCSVVCPLGVMQDIFGWLGKKRKRNRYGYSPGKNILRALVFAVFVASLVLGIPAVVTLLEPYSAYGRVATNILRPMYEAGNNVLAYFAERADSYLFSSTGIWLKGGLVLGVSVLTLLCIGFLAWRNGRTYCNTVCPVGTLLGFLSRFSLLKPLIDTSKCNSCGLCARNCKAACIDSKGHKIDYSRCVACMDCLSVCRHGAIGYRCRISRKSRFVPDLNRRSFLVATAMTSAAAVMAQKKKKVDGGLAVIEDKVIPERNTQLTPPGSLSAQNMARHCTACQLCVSACPNGVLRPSTNLGTFMQPMMSYERGYCRPECTKCGNLCPTGAIRPVTKEDKTGLQIGHAVWIRKNCIPLTDGVECGNCARHCPAGAIIMVPAYPDKEDSVSIPVVDTSYCVGCGACEYLCPARPFSAIYVEGHEVHREI